MPGPRRARPTILAPCLLLALAGCRGGDASRRALESGESWVATMRLLAEQARTIHDPASGASAADRARFAARRRAALSTPVP